MTFVIIRIKGKEVKLASAQGYMKKEQAEQMKRILQRTTKDRRIKFIVRKVS